MLIIHLQATQPDTKAATKPTANTPSEMSPITEAAPYFTIFMVSSRASPRMGGMTMRKENWASLSLLLPRMSPVAMVEPERDRPGITATAWARPMMKASLRLMFSFWRGLA